MVEVEKEEEHLITSLFLTFKHPTEFSGYIFPPSAVPSPQKQKSF
jgi:hypothetical protein